MADPARVWPAGASGRRIILSGHVQGVGFRPFVYRLATHYGLVGQVRNELGRVEILAAGPAARLDGFERDLIAKAPPLSRPRIDASAAVSGLAFESFGIATSRAGTQARIFVPPDYFMCDDCRAELADPGDRRYRYPFINCTQCGPRYTLIRALPYDRSNTSMAAFPLCSDCEREYRDPANRRFHAEPVACPVCGPTLRFVAAAPAAAVDGNAALDAALELLRNGNVVAVKGIGGYHLMCDARSAAAVASLRARKFRPDKPLAVMFPLAGSDGLEAVRRYAELDPAEAELLASPARPIVLTTKSAGCALASNLAAGLQEIGAFLPYSPLHQLLTADYGGPLVATSGNISGEPVLTDDTEVESRLGSVADAFLRHDRPIVRPADDPVYRRIAGRMRPLRLGRGAAPVELELPWRLSRPCIAVGGQMKGTVALAWDDRVVVSPHIGEMDSPRSLAVFEQVAADLQSLYGVTAEALICDAHPGYTTHRWAKAQGLPVTDVWHHHAHASAVAAESRLAGPWLVFAWDGVGLGEDGSLWGGEALYGAAGDWRRVASFRPFRLPGGDRAGREPWRAAAALHWTCGRRWQGCPDREGLAEAAWRRQLNSPLTTAAGRLFDAAAAIIGRCHYASFEAQGPMLLESLARTRRNVAELPLRRDRDGIWRSDWEPLLQVIDNDLCSCQLRAESFHSSMAAALAAQARRIREERPVARVGLGGGVFQNRVLTEQVIGLLAADGFEVVLPATLPVNDAALSFGQVADVAAREAPS